MVSQNAPWTVRLNTLSRDGAIKVSTLLARAIDSDRITSQKTKIFIVGGAGKSLIVDSIARDLSDHHSPYKMPPDRFVEGKPSNAMGKTCNWQIVKGITHKQKGCVVTFSHLAGEHRKTWVEGLLSACFKSRTVGIDFLTEIDEGYNESFTPDISIRFHPDHSHELEKGWGRRWIIAIENPALRTDAMARTLKQLNQYELNRQARGLGAKPNP
jgi:hypothetical protein